jgi:acetyl-CoA carboxylase carboxyltransferase component
MADDNAPGGGLTNLFTGLQNIAKAISNANQILNRSFPQVVGTASTATGGAATLPAHPDGFMVVTNPQTGQSVLVPYYKP